MSQDLVLSLQTQNRLLKRSLGLSIFGLAILLLVAAKAPGRTRFAELDVERLNIVGADGKLVMVLSNRARLPKAVVDGRIAGEDRRKPGIIFYNEAGDECGGLIYSGHLDAQHKPSSGMQLSMDRFGGDQQLALGHYEQGGYMYTGFSVFDRGLAKDIDPLYEAWQKAPEGSEREAAKRRWQEAGGAQTTRLFVGKSRDKASVMLMADAQGRPRILMMVRPDGNPSLAFLDEKGEVVQQLPQAARP
jgi:hypothetical protein